MAHFRQLYSKIISDKHDDIMAKFGAILAQGILDAGKLFFLLNYMMGGQLRLKCTPYENKIQCYLNMLDTLHTSNYIPQGAQWLSGKVLDLRLRGCEFKPHQLHCVVSLSKTH